MSDALTHAKLLNFWKTNPNNHLGARLRVSPRVVAQWRTDGRVPDEHLRGFSEALLADFGIAVTLADLRRQDSHARWLGLYRTYAEFAKAMGVNHTTARWWRERGRLDASGQPMGRIPVAYWDKFIGLLKAEYGFVVTVEELAAAYRAAGEDAREDAAA